MSRFLKTAAAVLVATVATQVTAQTYTSCNPTTNSSCPSDVAFGTYHTWNWTNAATADTTIWNTTGGTPDYEIAGAEFKIHGQGDSPTLESNYYIFFGQVSCIMKAAAGTGIVSSIVLESDDLDEIDWEFLGGNNTSVETNYFGKGNTTSYDRAIYYDVDDVQGAWHNYTVIWTKEKINWVIDGVVVRTLAYADALDGQNYPQTPMKLKIGIWAGGDPDENSAGTVEWAGGDVDYDDAPFIMTMQSLYVEDYSSGSSYTYSDTSGNYTSITIASGNSTIANHLAEVHGISAKFNALPTWAKVSIAAGTVAGVVILGAVAAFCCIRNRRAGRRERALADAQWEKDLTELRDYNKGGVGAGAQEFDAGARRGSRMMFH